MRRCATALFLTRLALGQTSGDATLTGKIVDSLTRQPVSGAKISFRGNNSGPAATSDENGAFSPRIEKPDPGDEMVQVSLRGYATARAIVSLKPHTTQTRDFELSRAATISGRVIDRDSGNPLPGFSIQAVQRVTSEDEIGFVLTSAPTGAHGWFTVPNAAPGGYTLRIDPPVYGAIYFGEKKPPQTGYAPVFFPGVPRREMASPVTVAAGEDRKIEVQLRKHDLHRISGVPQVPEGMENDGIWIGARGPSAPMEAELPKAGQFQVEAREPGSYTILASTKTTPGHTRVFANCVVELADRDIEDLRLVMHPAVTLNAMVTMAEKDTSVPKGLTFNVVSIDGWGPESGTKKPDRLSLSDLPPGKYWAGLNVPAGYAVATTIYNGQTLAPSTAFDLDAPESDITFILTSRLGRITVTVRDADQKSVAGASVYLLPPSLPDTIDKFYIVQRGTGGMVKSDSNGGFFFDGIAAGQYKAVAVTEGDGPGRMLYIRSLLPSTPTIVLEPGQNANADIRIVK